MKNMATLHIQLVVFWLWGGFFQIAEVRKSSAPKMQEQQKQPNGRNRATKNKAAKTDALLSSDWYYARAR